MSAREEAQLLLALVERHLSGLRETATLTAFHDEDWGFLAQQTVEKLLKALWVLGGVTPPRTHALDPLFETLPLKNCAIDVPETLLDLEDFAVQARYDAAPMALPGTRQKLLIQLEELHKVVKQLVARQPSGNV